MVLFRELDVASRLPPSSSRLFTDSLRECRTCTMSDMRTCGSVGCGCRGAGRSAFLLLRWTGPGVGGVVVVCFLPDLVLLAMVAAAAAALAVAAAVAAAPGAGSGEGGASDGGGCWRFPSEAAANWMISSLAKSASTRTPCWSSSSRILLVDQDAQDTDFSCILNSCARC